MFPQMGVTNIESKKENEEAVGEALSDTPKRSFQPSNASQNELSIVEAVRQRMIYLICKGETNNKKIEIVNRGDLSFFFLCEAALYLHGPFS